MPSCLGCPCNLGVPAVLNPVALVVWPPLALVLLPLGPPNGLAFGIAIALWLVPKG